MATLNAARILPCLCVLAILNTASVHLFIPEVPQEIRKLEHFFGLEEFTTPADIAPPAMVDAQTVATPAEKHNVQPPVEYDSPKIEHTNSSDHVSAPTETKPMALNASELPGIRIALIRAIGNALPPRHDAAQTLRSLQFTLEHEVTIPNVKRHWLLNRIIDPQVQADVVALLDKHGESYTIDPFVFEEYGKIRTPQQLKPQRTDKFHMAANARTVKVPPATYAKAPLDRTKRIYAMNVNGARNFMLDVGLNMDEKPEWILPLDGNCFFTESAMHQMVRHLHSLGIDEASDRVSKLYAYIPMLRMQGDNHDLLADTYVQANATEEPQIAFHRDAKARFHPGLWYGKANKVELLIRLGVVNSTQVLPPKSAVEGGPMNAPVADLPEKSKVTAAGWVARLQSGNAKLEVNNVDRWLMREASVKNLLNTLDDKALRHAFNFTTDMLLVYDEKILSREREMYRKGYAPLVRLVDDEMITRGDSIIASWKNFSLDDVPADELCSNLRESFENITILALGHYMTQKEEFLDAAVGRVKMWLIDETTPIGPPKKWPCQRNTMNGLPHFADALRLLLRSSVTLRKNRKQIRRWMRHYHSYLENTLEGRVFYASNNRYGTIYDMQTTAVAAFLDDVTSARFYLEHAPRRFQPQMTAATFEVKSGVKGGKCEEVRMLTLQVWTTVARMGRKLGFKIWDETFDRTAQPVMCHMAHSGIPQLRKRSECHGNNVKIRNQRWWPLLFETQRECHKQKHAPLIFNKWMQHNTTAPPESLYDYQSVFGPTSTIAPFWNLGLDDSILVQQ